MLTVRPPAAVSPAPVTHLLRLLRLPSFVALLVICATACASAPVPADAMSPAAVEELSDPGSNVVAPAGPPSDQATLSTTLPTAAPAVLPGPVTGTLPGPVAGTPPTPATAPPMVLPTALPTVLPTAVSAALTAADRSAGDRALDAGRHPVELLVFAGIASGQRIADLQAGGGYTTELLARAVGPTGRVFSQNSAFVTQRFAQKPWTDRLAKPVLANVVRIDRELEDPLPPDARDLDAVLMVLFYHDTVWQKVDRAKMNAAIFRALHPGGVYVLVDHSARAGSGLTDVQTLHRIEESLVRDEVRRAGFQLAAEGDFLRNPADRRDWNDSPSAAGDRRGTSDRFVLKFVKP